MLVGGLDLRKAAACGRQNNPAPSRRLPGVREACYEYQGKILHTRNHTDDNSLENAAEIHWNIPVKIHWTSDNPLEHTTKGNFVGKCH